MKSNLLKISVDVHGSLRCHVASVGHTYPRVHMLIVGVLNWDHVILKFSAKTYIYEGFYAKEIHYTVVFCYIG